MILQGLKLNLVIPEIGMTYDKWTLSGSCGVGKLTLFPSDYISRQENGTLGKDWNSIERGADTHFYLFAD